MKTAYVVLGMHRSGTSSVAGALAHMGAVAPQTLMTPKPENPRGFWESEVLMALNDRLLQRCGSSWHDWRPLDATKLAGAPAADIRKETLDLLHQEFGGADEIVLKDPRICRFYDFWRSVLEEAGYTPLVISPIRAPMEVAASLAARNQTTTTQAMRLWLRHVVEAEHATRGAPRHVMAWDDFLSDWSVQLELMSIRLGRDIAPEPGKETALAAFLAPDLRHQYSSGDRLPKLVANAYAALLDLARQGESQDALDTLDGVRARFDEASELFQDAPQAI